MSRSPKAKMIAFATTSSGFSRFPVALVFIVSLMTLSDSVCGQSQTFNTPGAGTVTITPPAGVTSITVECWGGGGGGQGTNSGIGGEGGYYSRTVYSNPSSSYSYSVGAGGAVDANGGDTWFSSSTTQVAKGGRLGGNHGTAQTGSIGTNTFRGGAGGTGSQGGGYRTGGGGGGSATSSAAGSSGGNGTQSGSGSSITGNGGSGGTGQGAGGQGANGALPASPYTNATAGTQPGGGGGGAAYGSCNTGGCAAAGADGRIVVTYNCPTYSLTSISSASICTGSTATITLSGASANLPTGSYTVTYSLTGANSVSGQTASMTVSTAGSGSFSTVVLNSSGSTTITITQLQSGGSGGCTSAITSKNTSSFTVNTTPTVSVSGTTTVCNGTSSTLTASGASTYSWSPGGSTSAAIAVAPATTTSYTVTGTASNGCTSSASSTVTVNSNPSVSITGTNTICNGSSTTLTATGATTYSWSTSATTAGITVSPATTTTYTVTGTNTNGCTATATQSVTVNVSPAVPTGTDGARCGAGTISISASPGAGESIDWYAASTGGTVLTGGSGTTGFTTPSISATTTYYAQSRNTTTGCISSSRATVTAAVNSIPAAPTATNGSKSYTGTTNTTTISATVAAGSTVDWYAASNGGSALSSGSTIYSPVAINAGTYTYYAESRNTTSGCTSSSRTAVTLTINTVALTITGLTANNKVYDGTTTATLSGSASYSGLVGGESFSVSGAYSATFSSAGVGSGKSVAVSGIVAPSSNYTVTQPSFTANITAAPLTITADDVIKQSGTVLSSPVAGSTAFSSSGLVGSETIGSVTITYGSGSQAADANGTYSGSVTPSSATGGTFSASNYSISYVSGNLLVGSFRYAVSNGNWNSTATWATSSGGASGASVPAATDIVIVEGSSRVVTVNVNNAVCGKLTVGATNNSTSTLAFSNGSSLTVSGQVALGQSSVTNRVGVIDMTSGGTLTCTDISSTHNSNTFTAGSGTVVLTSSTVLPSNVSSFNNLTITSGATTLGANVTGSGALTISAGATLALSTFNCSSFTSLALEGGSTVGSTISGSGTLSLGGNVNVTSKNTGSAGATISCPVALGATRTFTVANDGTSANDLIVSGAISGSNVGIVKAGAGTLSVTGSNSFTGTLTINAGTFDVGANNTLADNMEVTVDGGTLYFDGKTDVVDTLTLISGNITGTTGVLSGSYYDFRSGTVNGGIDGTGKLVKTTSGTVTLSGNNTYSGGTVLSAGTLNVNSTTALGNGGTITINGGTLDNTSGSSITSANGASLVIGGDFTYSGTGGVGLNLGSGGITMAASRTITITNGTLTMDGTLNNGSSNLTKAGNGTLAFGSGNITINSLSITAGTLTSSSGTLSLSGDFTNNGAFSHNNGTIRFANPFAAQTISGTSVFYNMNLGKSAGTVTIANDVTVSNTLTFENGNTATITTGSNAVVLSSNSTSASVRVAGASGFVIGNLKRNIASGNNTYTFHVGTAADYVPATLAFTNVSTGGYVTVRTDTSKGPNYPSGLNATRFLSRYWTVTNGGIGTFSAELTCNYVNGELRNGAQQANMKGYKYSSGTTVFPSLSFPSANQARFSNITSFSEFGLGECSSAALSNSITNVGCYGASTGAINLTVSGASSPITYSWTGPSSYTSSSEDISGLAAGTYSVSITDAAGCTASGSYAVTQPSSALSASITSTTNVTCNGGSNGAATVSASGGTSPYTYSWSGGGTTTSISGKTAGSYAVTVTDANSCTVSATATITQPAALSVTTAPISSSCGAASVSLSTGITSSTSGLTVSYYSDAGLSSNISGTVTSSGTYYVKVTDANGCTTSGSIAVTMNALPVVAITGGSSTVCSGTAVELNASGAVSYSWSNGVLLAKTTVVPTVTNGYTVTGTGANGCTASVTRTITVNANPTASSTVVTAIQCFGETATINVTATGGSSPYSGTGNKTAAAGRYSFTVTDSNGCTSTTSGNLSQPGPISITGTSSAGSCGLNSPVVGVQVTGGVTPYAGSASYDVSGNCTYSVTDANGCTASSVINKP